MTVANIDKSVTVITVTYQSALTIRPMLKAAKRCYDAGLIDLVIVDNNSVDETCSIVMQEAPWARLVQSNTNNGFGNGCNIGFKFVTTPFTIFINPDAIVEPEALRAMLDFLDLNPTAGITGPAIIEGEKNQHNELQDTGPCPTPWTIIQQALPLLCHRSATRPIIPGEFPFRTGWVCGAVLLIRTELMKSLDGFDPQFFLYWEEMDLCKRAENLGFETWAIGNALTQHVGGASSPRDSTRIGGCIAKHYYQSRYYYMNKHHGAFAATIAELTEFLLLTMKTLVDLTYGRGTHRIKPRLQASLCSKPARI